MARRKEAHGGGHGWFVTFADLMGLLVSFFVMLVAFSNQDARKVQKVAGSMREAFGVQRDARYSGITEADGVAIREKVKNVDHIPPEDSSVTPTPDDKGSAAYHDAPFAAATASLRRALGDLPELAEASKHIMIEETRQGLNIELVDQDGRSMFAEGSKEPYEQARKLIEAIAEPLERARYRISIVGHTAPRDGKPGSWGLSVDRANSVRRILEEKGYPTSNIYKVAGRGDTEPLFPDDPDAAPNRRITIALIEEAPSLPPNIKP